MAALVLQIDGDVRQGRQGQGDQVGVGAAGVVRLDRTVKPIDIGAAVARGQLGQRLRRAMDPLGDVKSYLNSQKGGPNLDFKRDDV